MVCDIYVSRGGTQKTRSGRFFECVSIRTILNQEWPGHWKCAYKKQAENQKLSYNYVKRYFDDNDCELLESNYMNCCKLMMSSISVILNRS